MPYIGAKELKASDIRRFDVTSSTSATHTLTWTPPTEQSLIVTINGIKQHEDAYSVSGTTLTLSSSLVATDKLEVIGINDIGTTITPAQNSVNTDKIADDAVTSAKLANAINITSGNSLTIDSGATITNNGTASGFGGNNTPFASVYMSANQSVSASTDTLVNFDSEYVDTDNAFDTSTYKFTVPTGEGGNYMISTHVQCLTTARIIIYVYKNGSMIMQNQSLQRGGANAAGSAMAEVHPLAAGDYLQVYAHAEGGTTFLGTAGFSGFSVFKLVE